MKATFFSLVLTSFIIAGCSEKNPTEPHDHDDHDPVTTLEAVLTPQSGDTETRSILIRDTTLVAVRPMTEPDTLRLKIGAVYAGVINLYDESKSPRVSLNAEIDEEAASHRFEYTVAGGIGTRISIGNLNTDPNAAVYGRTFTLTVTGGAPATGTLRIQVFHYDDGNKSGVPETDRDVLLPVALVN